MQDLFTDELDKDISQLVDPYDFYRLELSSHFPLSCDIQHSIIQDTYQQAVECGNFREARASIAMN